MLKIRPPPRREGAGGGLIGEAINLN